MRPAVACASTAAPCRPPRAAASSLSREASVPSAIVVPAAIVDLPRRDAVDGAVQRDGTRTESARRLHALATRTRVTVLRAADFRWEISEGDELDRQLVAVRRRLDLEGIDDA